MRDEALAADYDWGYEWDYETAALCDERVRVALRERSLQLFSFTVLAELG